MRGKLGTIVLVICLVVVIAATMFAGYYTSTHHADAKVAVANIKLCRTQLFILHSVDDLAGTAQTLVASDTNLDIQVRSAFINKYKEKHAEIQRRIKMAQLSYCP